LPLLSVDWRFHHDDFVDKIQALGPVLLTTYQISWRSGPLM